MKLTKSTKYKRFYCSAYRYKRKTDATKIMANQAGKTLPSDMKITKKAGQWVGTILLSNWATQ